MELSKEIFGDELVDQLTASTDPVVKSFVAKFTAAKLILDDGKLVPQYRIQELTTKIGEQEKQLKKPF